VTLCRDGLPDRAVWLIIKRSCGAQPSSWYDFSNAPLRVRLPLFVWFSGGRWAIEPWDEEAKTERGMDHVEVRQYPGWHHHRRICMLAHVFLWHVKIRVGEKSPGLNPPPDADVIGAGLTVTEIYE
jgi:SRSO17 transposase